jgi:tetratricopeptide (TPR) repeat protein
MKWILLALFFAIPFVQAEGPDQEYTQIYNVIQQADTLKKSGNTEAATEAYNKALKGLKRLQSVYPTWNKEVLKFRVGYVTSQLQGIAPKNVATKKTSPSPTPTAKSNPFLDEVRRLQDEKARLEADLKKAQANGASAGANDQIARLQEQIIALEKERDLLKVEVEQANSGKKKSSNKDSGSQTGNREKEIEQLRARLEAMEARPTPFTEQELALFRETPTQIVPVESKPVEKSKELPAGAGALVAGAERAFAARRFDEAEQKYLEVLRQDENNVYILGNLAATQLEMNHVADAEKNIKIALQHDPDDAFSLTLLGIIKFRQNNFDEALDLLSRAAKINPQNAETQNYLGITLSQKGQRAAAEAALRKAVQLQPNYAGAHHNLAVIYATQNPPFLELARWHYQRALSLGHPKNPELEKILKDAK